MIHKKWKIYLYFQEPKFSKNCFCILVHIMNSDNTRVHGERGGKNSPLNYRMSLPVLYFVFDHLHSDIWWVSLQKHSRAYPFFQELS